MLAVAGLVLLVAKAGRYGDAWQLASATVFGIALVAMYTASTLFHGARLVRPCRALRVIDHCFIYVLIAGTYTPFALVTLRGPWGWSLFSFTWALAIAGIVFKLLFIGRFRWLSLLAYLVMGWCGVVALAPLLQHLPEAGVIWLLAGGACYSVGAIFFAFRRIPCNHVVWHLCVLAGSACHYLCVLRYVIAA